MREFDLDWYVHLLFTSSTPSPSRLSQSQEPQKNVSHITLLFLYANNIYDILIDITGARHCDELLLVAHCLEPTTEATECP